ncbi:MAG: hypothetical protein ACK516_00845 [Cyanobium sp.]
MSAAAVQPALADWSWREAGELLVSPPAAELALPYRQLAGSELLDQIVTLQPPAQPDPGLALALLEHPWQGADLQLLRSRADWLRRR